MPSASACASLMAGKQTTSNTSPCPSRETRPVRWIRQPSNPSSKSKRQTEGMRYDRSNPLSVHPPKMGIWPLGLKPSSRPRTMPMLHPLPGMLSIGQVGEKNPVLDQTTLEDTAKRSIAGMFDGPEKEFKCMAYPTDAGQQLFYCGGSGHQDCHRSTHLARQCDSGIRRWCCWVIWRNETQGDKTIDFVVPCKQNGKTKWGKVG